jgi:hypothetical protein
VVAIRDNWTKPDPYNIGRAYTVDTDSLGAYVVKNLVPGTYIVLALPLGSYAPAYYTNDTMNTRWKKATKITINGNTVSGINIYVRALNVAIRGYSGVAGVVRIGNQTPLAGAIVYAFLKNEVAGYGTADDNGSYEISGISPNSYTITVDMAGYDEASPQTANVSYLSNGSPVFSSVNFSVNSVATLVKNNSSTLPSEFALNQNYPNPFNPSTAIRFQLSAPSFVTLKVFDILGREVAMLVNGNLGAGSYTTTFDASHLSSGVYLYQLKVGDGLATSGHGFVQTKKMVLTK